MSIYDFEVLDYKGNPVKLEKYRGKVLLIVNTATKCGFTKQYDGLEKFYLEHKDEGFEILDFPCDQFLHQAPGTNEEIHDFCILRFAIAFPQFSKIKVNGKEENPLYTYLKNNCEVNKGKRIKWNFTKFLISKDGTIVSRYEPNQTIDEFKDDIIKLLIS
ncbi:MAG: glutathione peroxidase [Candidatus Onthovivens sp.]|nr:glutathione peroxidase [Mollicutes bacterium]MDD6468426.1 glutathione peroxidase [Bacilli bacterium]MDY2724209.1 glutathione peroxidase [Candidatus Onthovivens sp.]MCI6614657.1 glutathione peroxidase [Mollicutes bacterium]MCI7224903.1 glutathione peroxidase [Mollicutes bacterium]